MSQANLSNQYSIRVEPTKVDEGSDSELQLGAHFITGILLFLVVLKVHEYLDFGDWVTRLITGVCLFAAYVLGVFATRWGLSAFKNFLRAPESHESNAPIEYWLVSDRKIQRHHTNHVEIFSLNSVVVAELKSEQQIDVQFSGGQRAIFKRDKCRCEQDWDDAVALLHRGTGANRNNFADFETVSESTEVQACYNQQEIGLLEQRNGDRKQRNKYRITFFVVYVVMISALVIHDWLGGNFTPGKTIIVALLTVAGNVFPSLCARWQTAKLQLHTTHFWRISPMDFRFGKRLGNAYHESVRNWQDLTSVEETPLGIIVSFQSPEQVTLIPKESAPARHWVLATNKLRKLAAGKFMPALP